MSYRVIIKKGEIFIRRWNSDKREYEITTKKKQTLSGVLQFPVDIEETTFGQFFELIAREADFFQKSFESSMYGHPIQPYIDEVRGPAPEKKSDDLWHTEVHWGAELFEGEVEIFPDFSGYGKWPQQGQPDFPTEGAIALEYTPLNEYKDFPLKLNKDFELWEMGKEKTESKVKGILDFTVYDVINAILGEITWSGDISKGRKGLDLPSEEEMKNAEPWVGSDY